MWGDVSQEGVRKSPRCFVSEGVSSPQIIIVLDDIIWSVSINLGYIGVQNSVFLLVSGLLEMLVF